MMLYATSAAEQWQIDDEPEEGGPKRGKPKCRKLPYAVIDDPRPNYRLRCFLGWRARHSVDWHSNKSRLKQDTAAGEKRFRACIKEGKELGYLERKQVVTQPAKEKLNLKAAPPSARGNRYLRVSDEDLTLVTFREIGVLDYLRSHALTYVQSASHIASKVKLKSEKTARSICNSLVRKGLAARFVLRNEKGHFEENGYAAAPWELGPSERPSGKKRRGTKTARPKTGAHNKEHLRTSLRENTSHLLFPEEKGKSITPTPGASASMLFSGEGEGKQKASTHAERKAAREQRDIANLYKRTGVEEPFTKDATFAEAVKRVNSMLAWEANRGVDIYDTGDGKHLVEVEFFDEVSDEDWAETYAISDKHLRDGIRQATDGRIKPALLGKEGLRTVRLMLARLVQETDAEDALDILLGYLRKRIGSDKDAYLNGWNLVAQRFAGALYGSGIDSLRTEQPTPMTPTKRKMRAACFADGIAAIPDCRDEAKMLASKFKARDWNGCIAPHLFSEQNLLGLEVIIGNHGVEAVDDIVSEYIARSKTDRTIERGHVKNWLYFQPAIVQQVNSERELQKERGR
jgi:hypothetical protein